ncbi:MAG: tyrosine-type recombinase/integrase [Bacteroidales bacterium]
MKTITVKRLNHREEERLALYFDYDSELTALVKKLPGRAWSRTLACWHLPVGSISIDELRNYFQGVRIDYCKNETDNPLKTNNHQINLAEDNQILAFIDERKNIFYCAVPYELKERFKTLEGAWWHPGARTWSAMYSKENIEHFKKIMQSVGFSVSFITRDLKHMTTIPVRGIRQEQRIEPDYRFERFMLMQGKKESTIRQYKSYVTWFLSEQADVNFSENSIEQIQKFIHEKVLNQHFGQSQQNGVISAIKLYFLAVYKISISPEDIPRPKRDRPLPKVISEEEFIKMVSATKNHKHKLILLILYGCGLRRGELCRLRVEDIDFDREMIFVKGKGNKYRAVNPGHKLLLLISRYIKSYLPDYYLFEGVQKKPYSGTSVGIIVRRAAKEAGIRRRVHAHMLRHSYATHHMERGIELRLIQETLGHASSKTTEIYTYVSRRSIKKMPNLLDELKI